MSDHDIASKEELGVQDAYERGYRAGRIETQKLMRADAAPRAATEPSEDSFDRGVEHGIAFANLHAKTYHGCEHLAESQLATGDKAEAPLPTHDSNGGDRG